VTRLLLFIGGSFGDPGERPWRFRFVVFGTTSGAVTLVEHVAGSRFHAPEAWGSAVSVGIVLGVACTATCELIVRNQTQR
jgi:hypothetical protein